MAQPQERDRTADLSQLKWDLVSHFMLTEHRNQGTLNWALQHLLWRMKEQKKIKDYEKYRMSTCINPACATGLFNAFKTPLFIGFCKDDWEAEYRDSQRGILAHEASHKLHDTLDLHYGEYPFERIWDSYAWGLAFQ
jgi:hypothetical protein